MAKDVMPAEFWTQGENAFGKEPALLLIYAEITKRMQDENPEADTLELMLIERVAFLYVHTRYKETRRMFDNDRAYKETLQVWAAMAADLRKERVRQENLDVLRDIILTNVHTAFEEALKSLPKEYRDALRPKLADSLEKMGV